MPKKLKIKGGSREIHHQPIPKPTHLNLCRGNLDITYYTVPLLSTKEENWGSHEIQRQ